MTKGTEWPSSLHYRNDGAQCRSSSSELKDEPVWFHRFLTFFTCQSVPKILFTQAAQPAARWDNSGEVIRVDLNCLRLVHARFKELVDQPSWSERYTNIDDRRRHVENIIECGDVVVDEVGKVGRDLLLAILTIVASVFPEPVCLIFQYHVPVAQWFKGRYSHSIQAANFRFYRGAK